MAFKLYTFYYIVIGMVLVEAYSVPSKQNTNGDNFQYTEQQPQYAKQVEDENVLELKNLKSSEPSSVSEMKLQKSSYVNVNGQKERRDEFTQQVNENGELMERIKQKIQSKQESELATPDTRVLTEIEISPKGIRKPYEEDGGSRNIIKKKFKLKRRYVPNKTSNNLIDEFKLKNIVRYLPEEMAEYIYETGDEKTIAIAIENYLQLGILSREEALIYLQRIKSILNNLKEREIREKKPEEHRVFRHLYGNSRNKVDVNEALSDLRDIQELIRKYELSQEENNNVDFDNNYEWENEKYESKNLNEKLQNFESLFSKSSMEEVIYHLAKILFYQSFSINGFEAQESVKEFTAFLEKQIQEGRISRSMERKVFNILTAALTDILNEHPELIITDKNNEKYRELNINVKAKNSDSLIKNTVTKKNVIAEEENQQVVNNLKTSGIMDDKKMETSNK